MKHAGVLPYTPELQEYVFESCTEFKGVSTTIRLFFVGMHIYCSFLRCVMEMNPQP